MNAGELLRKRGLPVLGVVVLCMQLFVWLPRQVHRDEAFDTDVYYAAARHAAAGEQVYGRQQRVRTDEVPSGFFYPPTALALVAPARYVSLTTWRYFGFGLAILSMWAFAAALVKLATGRCSALDTLALGTLLPIFPPVGQSLNVGNLDMLVIAMTAWAFAAPRFAGVLLVLGAAVKVYPGFALFAWALHDSSTPKRFRNQVFTTVLICIGVELIALDARYINEWGRLGLYALNQPVAHFGNWSLSMLVIYPDIHAEVASTPRVARAVLSVVPLVAAGVAAFFMRKRPVEHAAAAALIAGTWFTAFCWWWRILPMLLIPAAMWYRQRHLKACTGCAGRGFFEEPTNFGDQGMQRIWCPDCIGKGVV